MTRHSRTHVFLVDDEPSVLRAVERTLDELGLELVCFESAAACLEKLRYKACDLLITDVKMPGMDGIELLARVKHLAPWMPVLVVTGFADVEMAVRAMKNGAADFIRKPLERHSLLQKVRSILEKHAPTASYRGKPLTPVEMRVLRLVYMGYNNKGIARMLGRAVRTVEDHRRHIMGKLDAHSQFELANRVNELGWFRDQ